MSEQKSMPRFYKLRAWMHNLRFYVLAFGANSERRDYLKAQFMRTRARAEVGELKLRTQLLSDKVSELFPLGPKHSVLCIGCRNGNELDYIRLKGAGSVVGIDVISTRQDILVMDMHELKFPDNSFDVVYTCHSFEHAYDPMKVGQEIARVLRPGGIIAIEVPVNYKVSGVDRFDYANKDGVKRNFVSGKFRELWAEEQPPGTLRNAEGNTVVRLVMQIEK